jgi:hypothetical protein
LSYQKVDANSYTGVSYYRLKIITSNNTFTYSNVISVPGKTKGGGGNPNNREVNESTITTVASIKVIPPTNTLTKKVTVGPNPNNGNFWFSINGIEKETIATLYTIDGKQINQFRVVNLQQQHVNNLSRGIYLLKVEGFETQKIIVNGSGSGSQLSKEKVIDNTKL